LQGSEVEGKSVSWSTGNMGDKLAYYADCGGGCTPITWINGLVDFNVNINRQAYAYKNSNQISDGESIAVGDTISFIAPIYDTDISWNGTGRSSDTPYGHWLSGAVAPNFIDYVSDFVSTALTGSKSYNIYIPLSVNPSTITYTHIGSTAGLDCNGDSIAESNPTGASCVVKSAGTVLTQVNYGNTYGKFYYHYIQTSSSGFIYIYYNKVAMRRSDIISTGFLNLQTCVDPCPVVGSSDYTLSIPSQTISFSLTAVSNNNLPTAPTIAGPTTGITTTPYTFTLTGTDPDNDTIRYGIDWNSDNLIDLQLPSSGYVPSGTAQVLEVDENRWTVPGTYTFRALTQDVNSATSTWTTHTITIDTLPTCTSIPEHTVVCTGDEATGFMGSIASTLQEFSASCTLSQRCEYLCAQGYLYTGGTCTPTQCNDGIDNDTPPDGLTDLNDPGCENNITNNSEFNPPENPVLTVDKLTVIKDGTVTLTWDTNNGNESLCTLTAYSGGSNLLTADGDAVGSLDVTIPARSTYTLSCPNPLGGAPLTDTVSIDIVPVGVET